MAMRIAVLFDADNVSCNTASATLDRLADRGNVVVARAVGDFSTASLANWIGCARERGIDLVMQPGLGKGKKATDIRLTIEAMDLTHAGRVDTVALVSHDVDFTPLALRLRNAGLSVLGFSHVEPSASFKAACSGFEVVGQEVPKATAATELTLPKADQTLVAKPPPIKKPQVATPSSEVERLKKIAKQVSAKGPVSSQALNGAVKAAIPPFGKSLSGKGSLKHLLALGIVERVGKIQAQLVRALP